MRPIHLDKEAQKRIVGEENNYSKAMEKLDRYYGDKRKVINACVSEINNFSKVTHNDFKQLVALKSCLEQNYARLKNCSLESEMSNTSCMKVIKLKFSAAQQLKWTEHLENLP